MQSENNQTNCSSGDPVQEGSSMSQIIGMCVSAMKCPGLKKHNKVVSNAEVPDGWEYLLLKHHRIRILHHVPTPTVLENQECSSNLHTAQEDCDKSDNQDEKLKNNTFCTNTQENGGGVENKAFCPDEFDNNIAIDKISTTLSGDPFRPLIFFVHGIGGSSEIWNNQILYFLKLGFEIVAFDMLGHGFSSAPHEAKYYKFRKLLCIVLAVFDKYVETDRKCIIVGHSYGASFSAAVARYRSNQVILLIMISSGGPAPLIPAHSRLHYSTCLLNCIKPLLFCGFHREIFYTPRGKQLKFADAFDIPKYVLENILKGQYWPEGDVVFHKRISIPTLLVYGLKDQLVNLVEECDMERTIPRAHLELIPNAGHMVMIETPLELNKLMANFITKWLK